MTRAAIVARVSHKQQLAAGAGGRHSLISQRETLERMAERNGWDIVATYEIPGESAFRDEMKARPLFARVLEAAERHEFDVLLVSELSRFSRSFVVGFNVLYRLRQLGIGLYDERGTDYTLEARPAPGAAFSAVAGIDQLLSFTAIAALACMDAS